MTRSIEEVKEIVENLGYIYIDSYSGNKSSRKIVIQDKFGYKYDITLNSILGIQGISFVHKSNPFSLENISLWLKLNNSQFTLLENNKYIDRASKLNLYCNVCKDYPKMSWDNLSSGSGCGVCAGQQIGQHHNLAVQRPDIAKEWHKALNGNLTPKDVTFGSEIKAWWSCPKGHEYRSTIGNRANVGSGCPVCANEQKESRVATELKQWCKETFGVDNVDPEHKMFKNSETGYWLRCDVYIGKKRGYRWSLHRNSWGTTLPVHSLLAQI